MLQKDNFKSPSKRAKQESFSFVDGFADEKETKTMANSIAKRSDLDTTSCCTNGLGSDCQRDQMWAFYSQSQGVCSRKDSFRYGVSIQRQINYQSVQQYQESLQSFLEDINMERQNKIYLRLIILDPLYHRDCRFESYFQFALQQYRLFKESYFDTTDR